MPAHSSHRVNGDWTWDGQSDLTLAEKLRQLRIRRDWSLLQLAAAAGLPRSRVAAYEQGERQPRWGDFVALAQALETPLDAFRDCIPSRSARPSRRNQPFAAK